MSKFVKYAGVGIGLLLGLFVIFGALNYHPDIPVKELEPKYFTKESSWVELPDARMHVRLRGKGPALFLIHGSFSSLHTWNEWENILQTKFQTISIDLPGHGLTGPDLSDNYTPSHYAELVIATADKLNINQFAIAGNSLGGMVAAMVAAQNPGRVTQLILIDAAGIDPGMQGQKTSRPLVFRIMNSSILSWISQKITPKLLVTNSLKQVYADPKRIRQGVMERYFDLLLREGNRQATVKRFQQRGGASISFKSIHCPTLILWGQMDRWIPEQLGRQMHDSIPGSTYVVLPNVGHVPMEEVPTPSAAIALKFLQENKIPS